MHCEIILMPKLMETRKPINNSYLHLVNKIKLKYEIYRWNNRLFKLTLRNMWPPYNEGFTNKVLINKYINSLEIYKTVTNIGARVLKQVYGRDKEVLNLFKSTLTNMVLNENTITRIGEKTYKEIDRVGNKNLTLNEIHEMYFGIERKNINLYKNNIFNHVENINLLSVLQNNVGRKIILNDARTSINKNISKINEKTTNEISYLLLDRKQYKGKIVSESKKKFTEKIIQQLDTRVQHFNTINNKMYVLGRKFIKNYKCENRNDDVSQNVAINNVEFNDLQLQSVLSDRTIVDKTSDKTTVDKNYEILLSKIDKKNNFYKIKKLFENIVEKQSIVKLRDINVALSVMDISNLTKEFYLRNINHLINSQLVEDKSTKLSLKAQSEDKVRIFYDRTRAIKSENIKIYKNNTMTHLNHSKKVKKDSCVSDKKEVKPIEKEIYSRTFLSESKENRSFSDIDINEINILADRVFKVIEKRIEIRKDRRGVR